MFVTAGARFLARARDFYARHGFVADGTEQVEPEFGAAEIRMVRRRAQPV